MKVALVALVLTFSSLAAGQQLPRSTLLGLLPPGAEIIETANLNLTGAKPRLIVLWMLSPKHGLSDTVNRNREDGYCSDIIHGDFGKVWDGPTRLSLFDSERMRLMNTIEIRFTTACIGCGPGEDSMTIPLCLLRRSAANTDYSDQHSTPNLDLRDYTGRGIKTEFALSVFEAFGIASTGVFGYDPKNDRVLQYPVELHRSSENPLTTMWTEQVFEREPVRAGYWKFSWMPGHGDPSVCTEQVSFDRTRQMFVQKQNCMAPKKDRPQSTR